MNKKFSKPGELILAWIAANLLGAGAIWIFTLIFSQMNAFPRSFVSSLVVGIPIGLAQWFVLRRLAPVSILWIFTISVGLQTGLFVLTRMDRIFNSIDDESLLVLTAGYLVIGLMVGLFQWIFLWRHFARSPLWLLSNPIALWLGTALILVTDLVHQNGFAAAVLVTLVYAALTGLFLIWIQPSLTRTEANLAGAA